MLTILLVLPVCGEFKERVQKYKSIKRMCLRLGGWKCHNKFGRWCGVQTKPSDWNVETVCGDSGGLCSCLREEERMACRAS